MTKIGEGGQIPKPSEHGYKTELQGNIARFEQALFRYSAATPAEKARYDGIMKQEMAYIKANVKEIKIAGIQKQGEIVSSGYEKFSKDPTEQNLTTLQQVLSTLKEYAFLP